LLKIGAKPKETIIKCLLLVWLQTSFNNELAEAIEWTNNNPTEAGALANKYINANSELIANALPGFRFEYKSSADSKEDLEQDFNVLLELKPETIGGKLPDDNFYYTNE
jgi:NitT/TauT family transport system substrate-binding protein